MSNVIARYPFARVPGCLKPCFLGNGLLRTQFQAQRARPPVITAVVETASLARYDDLFRVDIEVDTETAPDDLAVAS
ncbi:hypothetical protein [Cryobacterium sp. Y57]|uniref:hypothetical protein n=1 Tax=Cryobacterium sp. Y57 TaxID=2048287 RepID=UPI000CE4A5A3|nr:hypothetical protein [Cryobacterium sp. Y57]